MQVWLRWVFITLCAMEAILASSLAKVTSTASLAKASGAVSGSVLVGLKSMREWSWAGWWGFEEAAGDGGGHREGPAQGPAGTERVASSPVASLPCPALPWAFVLALSRRRTRERQDLVGGSSGGLLPTLPPRPQEPCLAPAPWPSLPLDSPPEFTGFGVLPVRPDRPLAAVL